LTIALARGRDRDAPDRAGLGTELQDGLAHVIAIEPSPLARVGGRHGTAGRSEVQPLQKRGLDGARPAAARTRALLHDAVNPVPELEHNDRLVLARIGRALVDGIADVDPVVQELVKEALVDRLTL
jgi:hypothetical protein